MKVEKPHQCLCGCTLLFSQLARPLGYRKPLATFTAPLGVFFNTISAIKAFKFLIACIVSTPLFQLCVSPSWRKTVLHRVASYRV
jgi:hypothetical protein